MASATHPVRGIERASLVGALSVAGFFLTAYIATLESYDEPNTFSHPAVVAYITVVAVGMVGIVAILFGARRSLAIPIMTAFGLGGLIALASYGGLLVIVAGLLVPSILSRPLNSVGEQP